MMHLQSKIREMLETAWTGFGLGAVGGIGLMMLFVAAVAPEYAWMQALGAYCLTAITTFHMSEYTIAVLYRPHDACPRSFLVTHSKAYTIAMVSSWVEFFIELYFFPAMKVSTFRVCVGALGTLLFYSCRALAMIHAGSNFSLLVEYDKREDHKLVTTGIYARLRHPSYFGWFWQTIFTQVTLSNPVCCVGFGLAAWKFFQERIPDEEDTLVEFFGPQYVSYCKQRRIGIPFIKSKY
jgi:protein-S-isoprenylcysteine O-methyltransferase